MLRPIDAMSVENRRQVDIFKVAPEESGQSVLSQALDPFRSRSVVEFWVVLWVLTAGV